ncbi:MAG: hypothetical protein KGM44_06670, partial [bacterium]|nr:hypothetical protein [bacterium]
MVLSLVVAVILIALVLASVGWTSVERARRDAEGALRAWGLLPTLRTACWRTPFLLTGTLREARPMIAPRVEVALVP